MNYIPEYPIFSPLLWEMYDELYPLLNNLTDGVSEFTFSGLFLHRFKYGYQISQITPQIFIVTGEAVTKKFFMTLGDHPSQEILNRLFIEYPLWKNIPPSIIEKDSSLLISWGYLLQEDRDNSDYLYLRTDLVALSGKRFHKKKNLLNAFMSSYSFEVKPLNSLTKTDALLVLENWRQERDDDADYIPAKESLEFLENFPLSGVIVYADGKPAGWALGEILAGETMYAVHFEKGLDEFHGIYQVVNHALAESLPETISSINREQDLGDLGMRQAKMTYRPCGFVKKYTALKN